MDRHTHPAPVGPPPAGALGHLFDGPGRAGLTDGELLARFVATGDEAAFEGLVARLGPMVLGACRRMLGDRADADDAFQATFLVLVRRARSVGRGDLIGPWLHGVAVRVCRKARAQAGRRRSREQTGLDGGAASLAAPLPPIPAALAGAETLATIDAEIARLPERDRRLVVLCDVEGLTRAEAADRLGWTPNMVRGRLARARGRLRAGLVRRGCVPPGRPAAGAPGLAPLPWLAPLPASLAALTARAAFLSLSPPGRGAAAVGLATTSALSLANGVLRAMSLTSWKFAAGLIATGALAAGALTAAQGPADPAATPRAGAAIPADPAVSPPSPGDAPLPTLLAERLRLARGNFETLQSLFDGGRTTIDRLIDADRRLLEAEVALAATPERRRDLIRAQVGRLRRIHDREVRELEAARATPAGVALAATALVDARILLARDQGPAPAAPAEAADPAPGGTAADPIVAPGQPGAGPAEALPGLLQARLASARGRYEAQLAFYDEGRIAIDRLIDASRQWMQAEHAQAATPARKRSSVQAHVDRLREIHGREVAQLAVGRATAADVAEVADALLEAQILLARDPGPASDPAPRDQAGAGPGRGPGSRRAVEAAAGAARELAELKRLRVELARQLFAEASRLHPAELPTPDYLAALRDLADAELAAATSREGRARVFARLIEGGRRAVAATEDLARRGEKPAGEVLRARLALVALQARAAEDAAAAGDRDLDRRLDEVERLPDRPTPGG